jgi:hypothetical protein
MRPVLLLILLGACSSHTPAAGESPAEVCRPMNQGKIMSASGYLVAPLMSLTFDGGDTSNLVYVSPRRGQREGLTVHIPVGEGPGKMRQLPSKSGGQVTELRDSDFQFTDDAGKAMGLGDVVRVTGTVALDGRSCSLDSLTAIKAVD